MMDEEKMLRQWFRRQRSTLIGKSFHKDHDEDEFVAWYMKVMREAFW